jgi:hypothetical protein
VFFGFFEFLKGLWSKVYLFIGCFVCLFFDGKSSILAKVFGKDWIQNFWFMLDCSKNERRFPQIFIHSTLTAFDVWERSVFKDGDWML